MGGLNIYSAAHLLGLDPSAEHTRQDIRNAYKAKTAKITYEDSPEEFADLTRAYQLLMKAQRTSQRQGSENTFTTSTPHSTVDEAGEETVTRTKTSADSPLRARHETPTVDFDNPDSADESEHVDIYDNVFSEIDTRTPYAELHRVDTDDNPAYHFSRELEAEQEKRDYVKLLELAKEIDLDRRAVKKLISEQRSNLSFTPHSYQLPSRHRTSEYYEFLSYLYTLIGKERSPALLRVQDNCWLLVHLLWWGLAVLSIAYRVDSILAFMMVGFVLYPSKERLAKKKIFGFLSVVIRAAYLLLLLFFSSLWIISVKPPSP